MKISRIIRSVCDRVECVMSPSKLDVLESQTFWVEGMIHFLYFGQ